MAQTETSLAPGFTPDVDQAQLQRFKNYPSERRAFVAEYVAARTAPELLSGIVGMDYLDESSDDLARGIKEIIIAAFESDENLIERVKNLRHHD